MAKAPKGKTPAPKKRLSSVRKPRKPAQLAREQGRRGHKKAEEIPGLRDWLIEQFKRVPKPTYKELHADALATGFAIGRTAIWQWRVEFEARKAERDLAREMAREYNESAIDGEVLDVETAIATMASQSIWSEVYAELQGKGPNEETQKLLALFVKLQSSSSTRERVRFAVNRGRHRERLNIIALLQETLKRDPETLRKVVVAIRSEAAKEEARR